MTDIFATIQYDDSITVVDSNKDVSVPSVGIQGASAADATVGMLSDVDASNLVNGSVLVYKTNTNKWTSTTKLDAQDVEAGEF